MTPMKTFKEFMIEKHGIQDANDYAGTFTQEIAIAYASQAIDRCAEKARVKTNNTFPDRPLHLAVVDKDSILSVKDELK